MSKRKIKLNISSSYSDSAYKSIEKHFKKMVQANKEMIEKHGEMFAKIKLAQKHLAKSFSSVEAARKKLETAGKLNKDFVIPEFKHFPEIPDFPKFEFLIPNHKKLTEFIQKSNFFDNDVISAMSKMSHELSESLSNSDFAKIASGFYDNYKKLLEPQSL